MFKKVMVGVDSGATAKDAIRLGQELVAEGGELILAHVHGGYDVYRNGMVLEWQLKEQQTAHKLLAELSAETGVERVESYGATNVGRGLHMLAEREGADLLVLGSTRRSLLGRVFLGDDTRDATNGAPCAIAVAPAGYSQHTGALKRIGVAYNQSSESHFALDVARELAAVNHAAISVFEVVTLAGYWSYPYRVPYGDLPEEWISERRAKLDELSDVTPKVTFGDAAEELTQDSKSVDLMVVGSRDFGPFGRLLHSSTSAKLAHSCHCPLLILTRANRESAARTEHAEAVPAQTPAAVS
ncbi:MAG: universal stress protein [Solirubrobacterales bacterium]|nr:universal stress protein [Solirubrobacterales bacterium]